MKIENLITENTVWRLTDIIKDDMTIALKIYVNEELQDPSCDKIKLYFKKRKIYNHLYNKILVAASLLAITDMDQLLDTLRIQVNIEGTIEQLNKEYDELAETLGLEMLIEDFSL